MIHLLGFVKRIVIFLVCVYLQRVYHVTKTVQSVEGGVPVELDSIALGGALTRCALIKSACDLKAAQMKVPFCLIWIFLVCEFERGYNSAGITKKQFLCVR